MGCGIADSQVGGSAPAFAHLSRADCRCAECAALHDVPRVKFLHDSRPGQAPGGLLLGPGQAGRPGWSGEPGARPADSESAIAGRRRRDSEGRGGGALECKRLPLRAASATAPAKAARPLPAPSSGTSTIDSEGAARREGRQRMPRRSSPRGPAWQASGLGTGVWAPGGCARRPWPLESVHLVRPPQPAADPPPRLHIGPFQIDLNGKPMHL
jgi:hypothetical protein